MIWVCVGSRVNTDLRPRLRGRSSHGPEAGAQNRRWSAFPVMPSSVRCVSGRGTYVEKGAERKDPDEFAREST